MGAITENQTLVLEQKYFRLSHNLIETLIDAINDNSSEFIRNNVSKCALAWFEANFTKRAQSLLAKRVLPVIGQALLFYDAVTASESLAQSSGVIWDVSRKEEWLLNFEFSHCVMQNRLNQYYEDDTYCYSVYQDEGDGRVYAQQYHHGLLATDASFEPGNRSLTSEYPAIPVDFYSDIKVGKKDHWMTYSTSIEAPRYSVPMESHTNTSGNENSEGYTVDRFFSEPLQDLNGEWHSLLQKMQYKSESAERTDIYYPEARYDLYGTPLSIISERQSYDPVTDTFSRQLFSEPVQDKNEHWIALLNYTETQHPSYDSFTRYAPAQDNDGEWKAHTLEYQHRSFTQNSEHHDEYFHQLQQNHAGQWVSLLHRSRVINQRGENLRENYEPTQDSDGNWHAHPKEKRTRSIHSSAETESLERYYPPEQDNKGYYSSSLEVKTYSSSSSRSKTQYSAPKQISADRFDSYPIYSESFNGARAVITHYYPAEVGSNGEVYSLCEEVVDYYDFDNGGIRTRTDCGAPVARDGGYVNSQRVVTYYCFPYTGRVSSRATYRADGSSNSSEPNDCD
ncbi:hypothetical protein HGP28_17845 [Vibrio sp. SM6]|uniref:Uncharacterized protein n=1 Tax=Vibrio agarilyticus TaxID=2726741 RepID=A0A7X8YIH3_9VIBR|nr:hypothetical protein [Vibrio agarilyticus]NLS14724.1 hypothetical protein [Vibrio agarilyticus]